MADICPTAMIFIPCDGGLSHNEAENAQDDHLVAGAQVLLDVALESAGISTNHIPKSPNLI